MEATDEMIAMARRVADDLIPNPENESVVYKSFHRTAERAALAAIIETTERAATLARSHASSTSVIQIDYDQACADIAEAFDLGDHLKGPDNAQ